ncbi:MAG: hypothetical protein AAGH71_04635 [Planctomycetota bacterium]
MEIGPVRPRFRRSMPGTVEEAISSVMERVSRAGTGCVPRALTHHVDLAIAPEERRPWSPSVHMEFSAEGESGVVVHGTIGPQPATWTFFFFLFAHAVLIVIFGGVLGASQVLLKQPAWGLWAAAGGLALGGVTYLASQFGRRLAESQTRRLMRLVDESLGAVLPHELV